MTKIKVTDRTELMFSQAVALAQNGMMKSTIHANGDKLFVLNMDDTILIRFKMNQEFPQAVSFFANDYESPDMILEGDQVAFMTNSEGHSRKKICPKPKIGFEAVAKIWEGFKTEEPAEIEPVTVPLTKHILALLDDDLSHVEFHNEGGLKIIQKNIYSGARVEIENQVAKTGLLGNDLPAFEPIGIRTTDLKALFSFVDELTLHIFPGNNWLYFRDGYKILEGILGTCLYDEIGFVAEARHGR